MSIYVEGNNSELMKEIMGNRRLMDKFMDYVLARPEDKKLFEFVRYKDTGRLDILDNRPDKTKRATASAKVPA